MDDDLVRHEREKKEERRRKKEERRQTKGGTELSVGFVERNERGKKNELLF